MFFYLRGLLFTEDIVRFGGKLTERIMSKLFDSIVIDISGADSSSLKLQRLLSISKEITKDIDSIQITIKLNENQNNFYCIDLAMPQNVKMEILKDKDTVHSISSSPVNSLKRTTYFLGISFILLAVALLYLCTINNRGIIYWALSFSLTLLSYEIIILWRIVSRKFFSIKEVLGRA